MGIVPIVNENDTTATTEIKYGDNDRLAARVSQIIGADCLILLSDVDGLYTDNPKKNKETKLIKTVKEIAKKIKGYFVWLAMAPICLVTLRRLILYPPHMIFPSSP